MRRFTLSVLCVVAIGGLVRGDDEPPATWADPTLEDALGQARVVVRGHIQAPQTGEKNPRIAIEKVIAGDGSPGVSLPLWGSEGPPALDQLLSRLKPNDEGIFILRQAGDATNARLALMTPSFGRFVIRDGMVAGFFRSSFVSVAVKVDDYETFLRNAFAAAKGGKPDTAFIDSCRTTLEKLDPTADESAIPAHVALEGLRFGAGEKDARLATRFFGASKFQVRISAARVLERAGGEAAGDALLRLALNDADPAVRSVAITALAAVKPTPPTATKELLSHLKGLEADAIQLHVNVEDPRTNELPGPMYAAFETLRALGAGDEATPLALELIAKNETEPFMAGVLHLARVKAKTRVAEIVGKMRGTDDPYTFFNEKLGELLEELTGLSLGADRAAWQKYVQNEKK